MGQQIMSEDFSWAKTSSATSEIYEIGKSSFSGAQIDMSDDFV